MSIKIHFHGLCCFKRDGNAFDVLMPAGHGNHGACLMAPLKLGSRLLVDVAATTWKPVAISYLPFTVGGKVVVEQVGAWKLTGDSLTPSTSSPGAVVWSQKDTLKLRDYDTTVRPRKTDDVVKELSDLAVVRLTHGTLTSVAGVGQIRRSYGAKTELLATSETVVWEDSGVSGLGLDLKNRAGNIIRLMDGAEVGISNVAAVVSPAGLGHAHHYYDVLHKDPTEPKLKLSDRTFNVWDCVPPVEIP